MTNREAYLQLQESSGIKVGDFVKVLRKAKTNEMGWDNGWDEDMDQYVGQVFRVQYVGPYGIGLEKTLYEFPFFVLERVDPPAPIHGDYGWYEIGGRRQFVMVIAGDDGHLTWMDQFQTHTPHTWNKNDTKNFTRIGNVMDDFEEKTNNE